MKDQTTIDPADLLAFIASSDTMTTEQIIARWPAWHAMRAAARARYERERHKYRLERCVSYAEGSSDPMVASLGDAVHRWCHLPLIQACLTARGEV